MVKTVEITGKNLEIKDAPEKLLGTFETVIAEDTLTTRVYRLPKTRLFVIASVWYTDESMASKNGADSVGLELIISKSRRRDFLKAQHYADGEVPVTSFEVARVTTMAKTAGKTFLVAMECRNHKTK